MSAPQRTGGFLVALTLGAALTGAVVAVLLLERGVVRPPQKLDNAVRTAAGLPFVKGGDRARIEAGDELFAVDPNMITELSLMAPDWRISAFRWNAQDRFTLVSTNRKKPAVQTCTVGPAFERVVAAFSVMRARRALSSQEGGHLRESLPEQPVRLVINDDSEVGIAEWELVRIAGSGEPVVAYSREVPAGVEIDLDRSVFALLGGGCEILGQGREKRTDPR